KERGQGDGAAALIEEEAISEEGVPVSAPDTSGRETYRTDGGRTVYGGGGIVPDMIVRPDTLNAQERAFFEAVSKSGSKFSDVVFRYAVEYVRENAGLEEGFPVTQAMRDEFLRRLQEAGVEVTREQFAGAERLLDQRLGYEIAYAKWGTAAASQRANSDDNVVRAAVELLRGTPTQTALFERARTQGPARF